MATAGAVCMTSVNLCPLCSRSLPGARCRSMTRRFSNGSVDVCKTWPRSDGKCRMPKCSFSVSRVLAVEVDVNSPN